MGINDALERRASKFAERHGLALAEHLGFGVHGIVFASESQRETGVPPLRSAVKAHDREADYLRERDVYLRLQALGIQSIHGCHVPRLLRYDDQLWVIEMTVVSRPYVLDFAGAFLDRAPVFPEDVLADWRAEKAEQFGDLWPKV
jgi:hypothetical protein